MNALARQGIPLRADPGALMERNLTSLARALIASACATFQQGTYPREIAEKQWPDDGGAGLILRGPVSATSITGAPALLQNIVVAAVTGAVGAGVQLLKRGVQLNFDRNASITIPALIADADHAGFVGEGQPIPVRELDIATPATLTPHTIKAMWGMTRELVEGSNAEALTVECMKRSVGLAIDKYLFDDVAGDSIRPAGLRHGIAALTASTSTDPYQAMLDDISALLSAVSAIGGDVVLVAGPARGKMMAARTQGGTLPSVLASPMVAANDLIAVAVDGLAVAIDDAPEVRASRDAATQHETAPTGDLLGGSPVKSVFQLDSVTMRLRFNASWALRDPRGIAWTTTTAW